ncbi:hypothetical protein V8E36_002210, partial [Tilletia maclaganii]
GQLLQEQEDDQAQARRPGATQCQAPTPAFRRDYGVAQQYTVHDHGIGGGGGGAGRRYAAAGRRNQEDWRTRQQNRLPRPGAHGHQGRARRRQRDDPRFQGRGESSVRRDKGARRGSRQSQRLPSKASRPLGGGRQTPRPHQEDPRRHCAFSLIFPSLLRFPVTLLPCTLATRKKHGRAQNGCQ